MQKIKIAKVNIDLKNDKNLNLKKNINYELDYWTDIRYDENNLGQEQIANVKLMDLRRDAKRSNEYFWQI